MIATCESAAAYLPDQLQSGDRLTVKGYTFTIHRTSKRNAEGERLYRIRHARGTLGNGRFTRDMLQAEGAVML